MILPNKTKQALVSCLKFKEFNTDDADPAKWS
jgi:hypothetical protein